MQSIKIISVGKLKEKFYDQAAKEYIKRLSGSCKLEIIEVPEDKGDSLAKEGAAIETRIPAGALVVALCIEGREQGSKEFSDLIRDCAINGTSKVCFIIGGSNGLHDDIKNRADIRLSMSKMTFPHNLARVMLLEQLYRAFNIAQGGKYHK